MDWFNNLFSQKKEKQEHSDKKIGVKERIFLDYASATPVHEEVGKTMEKYWAKEFYNPNAIYKEGVKVKEEVEKFRKQIAEIFGAAQENVVFTSGGTEANTWVVRGVKKGRIIIDEESHPSVTEAAEGLEGKETTLVSSVTTDNKLGRKIREERKKNNSAYPLLHVDASQTAQYFNLGLETLACDILTLDSAKIYGPKGIGAIILRRGVKLDLPPQGTPPVALIAGFTKAVELALKDRELEFERLSSLAGWFVESLKVSLPNAEVQLVQPNVVNVSVLGILPEYLVLTLDHHNILVSAGPACSFQKPEPPETPVRFSFGRYTTEEEVKKASEIFCREVRNMIK